MPSRTTVVIPEHLSLSLHWGDHTADELMEVNTTISGYLKSAPEKTQHHIADVSKLKRPPIDLAAVRRATDYITIPNCGWSLLA